MDGKYFIDRRLYIPNTEEKYSKPSSEPKQKYNPKNKSSYKKEKRNCKDETN